MTLPFISAAQPSIGVDERRAVDTVLASGKLAQGPEVAAFESEFSDRLSDGRYAIAVNSGTSALHLGLLASGVGPGDEVIVPSFTFAATANAVRLAGATPVFADIEPEHYCLDPLSVEAAITPRTAAILPVHLYGHPAQMSRLGALAKQHRLAVIEDAAQAHGAQWNGRFVGTFGDIGAFSFYPTKNMTAGEGGMITTNKSGVARTLRLLRNQGMETRYANEIVGFNVRMTDLHAAIGRVQLTKVADWTDRRRANADYLCKNLRGVVPPRVAPEADAVWHQFTIRIEDDRDGFAAALATEHAIGSGAYYPTPVHRLPSFGLDLDLPHTERASREVLSLPIHPGVGPDALERIVTAVEHVAGAGR
ncbi:DegT/DnrJ/EryC1/StrS aminotransferase family protein [Frondihabitans sp. VKM Ac-2883]|uniref:DegT/DnrJ/EryC1/StrS family aminotransferase n=1 Tax=Frondihabitans sp. VKM Ac-2883 TaxID=2783823 RepID=UPI00188CF8D9|nr:DegT/DnrJ/EryC1/StrS family aminotransferase [Frondihabitans sp. VKM Ac-2883]MBF4575764.1 DegT/DnrJ/EryC1/StrS family aminotransferase [Frondihabitans sp. VKM Ac-2883]